MKVLLISDTEAKGGAAIAAARMARAFVRSGMEVGMVVNDPQDGPPAGPWRRFVIRSEKTADWGEVPVASLEDEVNAALSDVLDEFQPDAVSVHNIHGGGKVGWNVEMVGMCANRVPTVWTLHDAWSFTGRCAFLGNCTEFLEQCGGRCPTPGDYPFLPLEKIAGEFARKRHVLHASRYLAAASPSGWMAECAKSGIWKGREVRVVANCLDTSVYRPRGNSRKRLGLAPHKDTVLLCAANLDDSRKGMDLALQALEKTKRGPLQVLVMGGGGVFPVLPGISFVSFGFVKSPDRKAEVYSAADVMLHPAREDNLPNTVLECLACGTPVAGFDVGGMKDLLGQGESGCLAANVAGEDLAVCMDRCLQDGWEMGVAARERVVKNFSERNMVAQWTKLALAMGVRDS